MAKVLQAGPEVAPLCTTRAERAVRRSGRDLTGERESHESDGDQFKTTMLFFFFYSLRAGVSVHLLGLVLLAVAAVLED